MPPQERPLPDTATILGRSRELLSTQWAELLRLRRTVLKTSDPDAIHDLRVASRRFRAAVELFAPCAAKVPATLLRKQARKLTAALGALRNIDEGLVFFGSRRRADCPEDSVLIKAFTRLRADEVKRVQTALKTFEHGTLDRMVRKMAAGLSEDAGANHCVISNRAYFSEVSIRLYLPILQLVAASSSSWQRTSRHALRIAIKKLRYFFELAAVILGRDYAPLLEQLKEYQSILGRLNDTAELEALLRTIKLPKAERAFATAAVLAEEALLLKQSAALFEQKPLLYTFLI